jgi:23S rRNA (cytidine1920-2'-O)/16S rRNA (cytidine1409-2'-O)-methyltransferase
VASGRVLVAGSPADKPSRLVAPGEAVLLQGAGPRFVSRGGEKLDAALERFSITVDGRKALDAGASTGGFTDCLLQRGAHRVVAVDVGYGQLANDLRSDPRVLVMERTNLRTLGPAVVNDVGGEGWVPVDLVTADLSFISLRVVAPVLTGPLIADGGVLVVLVKPQFEAGRAEASRGKGVISDPAIWRRTAHEVASALGECGAAIMGAMASPLPGPAGNTEFLLAGYLGVPTRGSEGPVDSLIEAAVEQAVADREARVTGSSTP